VEAKLSCKPCRGIKTRRLTLTLRRKLKSPVGLLILGSQDEAMERLKKMIEEARPPMVVSVGDVVSRSMIQSNISPQVLIVDNRVMREPITPIPVDVDQTLHVKNPPGNLTEEVWPTMKRAIQPNRRTRVLVDGEEDLLTLAAVLCSPIGSLVVYGQPHKGIVVIKVTELIKETVSGLVKAMEIVA
jgi:uncharacterized protein (UPF0218 family)